MLTLMFDLSKYKFESLLYFYSATTNNLRNYLLAVEA